MKFKSPIIILTLLLNIFIGNSQVKDFKEKFNLPSKVKETSGLLFLNDKIITHNDSGDEANLYEIDSLSGNLLRTVFINNVTHTDWEDIADDESYIYIGDFGNNSGNRKDLKIFRILKSDFLTNNSISAEEISFSYEDQTNFDEPEYHNFDAEAFVVYDDSFLIFTKNRYDFKTNVYKIPKTIGKHSAIKVSTANVKGLITGATLQNDNFMLCGYNTNLVPFLIYISFNRAPGDNIFSSGFAKESLENELGQGSQVEGITSFDNGKYYISREYFSTKIGGNQFTFSQKLYEFTDERDFLLSTEKNDVEKLVLGPNPTSSKIYINSKKTIKKGAIYNTLGKKVLEFTANLHEIDISSLSKGIYLLNIQFDDLKSINRKIIKV